MFHVVVCQVFSNWAAVYMEVPLAYSIMNPVEPRINHVCLTVLLSYITDAQRLPVLIDMGGCGWLSL